jgi:hypothetical protein
MSVWRCLINWVESVVIYLFLITFCRYSTIKKLLNIYPSSYLLDQLLKRDIIIEGLKKGKIYCGPWEPCTPDTPEIKILHKAYKAIQFKFKNIFLMAIWLSNAKSKNWASSVCLELYFCIYSMSSTEKNHLKREHKTSTKLNFEKKEQFLRILFFNVKSITPLTLTSTSSYNYWDIPETQTLD